MKKIYLVSLGCPKNLVDTEYMAGMLCSDGFEVTGNPEDASFVLINTCAFILFLLLEQDVVDWPHCWGLLPFLYLRVIHDSY